VAATLYAVVVPRIPHMKRLMNKDQDE
jgi:hypothetical protein